MYRQGDLLFVKVDEIPKDAEEKISGVIAEGEVTGHTHRIRPGSQAALMIAANVAFVTAAQETPIDHEEHDTIDLPAGNWQVFRQQEYMPKGVRTVLD